MSNQHYSPEFKDEAVRQDLERGYSVAEISQRLGVSSHSLYNWVKTVVPDKTEQHTAKLIEAKSEILKLRAQLPRMERGTSRQRLATGTTVSSVHPTESPLLTKTTTVRLL